TQTASEPETPRALSSSPSQHGFQADPVSAAGSQPGRSPGPGTPSVVSDATSGSASDSWADGVDLERFNERLRGLSAADRPVGVLSPGQRVSDHENASSPAPRTPRRRVE